MMERLTKRIGNSVDFSNEKVGEFLTDHKAGVKALFEKLAHYEDLEEQGLILKLQESDWNHLMKQLSTIIANDFVVYCGKKEFIANQIFLLEYDEEFRFSATCRCFNGTENDWWCDEECEHGEDGKGCYITFTFSDIGKTVFLTKEEAEQKLAEMVVE